MVGEGGARAEAGCSHPRLDTAPKSPPAPGGEHTARLSLLGPLTRQLQQQTSALTVQRLGRPTSRCEAPSRGLQMVGVCSQDFFMHGSGKREQVLWSLFYKDMVSSHDEYSLV